MNGEHLSPKTRELLGRPIEERIAYIQLDSWIPYSQANRILQQLKRHEIEHERCRLGNAIRKAAAGTISGSKYSLLVLGQWCCLYATVVTVGIDFGYVDREPFFEVRAGHDGPAFRIIIALLYNIGKCRTFEPASPS